jgi:branched-chain amino acid transport system substrate-binding protein
MTNLTYSKLFWSLIIIFSLLTLIVLNYSFQSKKAPIYLAFVGPMTGEGAAAGKMMSQAIQLYLKTINKNGGVNGHQVFLDIYDDQNDSKLAREKALEIVKDNRAIAVIGHWYSSASISGGDIYRQYKIPAMTPGSTNVNVTLNNKWYFRNIFNAKSSGQFLANYVKKVFKENNVSIIHEEAAYGAYLAQIFEETSLRLGSQVKYKWQINSKDPQLDNKLQQIIDILKIKSDAGVIFLAVQAIEGVKIVKLMKDNDIPNRLIGETSFSEKTFKKSFEKYATERTNPGHYTNDIYVATPLIFDTANEQAQQFKEIYQETYKENTDWAAAYAVDSAIVLLEAIKKTDVSGQPAHFAQEREKIRQFLANLTNIDKAIEGLTGFNYFDENGDALKPVSIGVFRNANIISASTQLQDVRHVNKIINLDEEIEKERVLLIDDKYMYKTNVVYVGMELNEISEIDIKNLTYSLDFYLWFRFQGQLKTKNIEFLNSVDPIELEEPIVEQIGDQTSHLYRVQGRFKAHYRSHHFAYQKHELSVSFRHKELTRENLIYVTDILGMGLTGEEPLLSKIERAQVLSPSSEWSIQNIWFFQDTIKRSSLGSLKYLNVPGREIEYSRFNAYLKIENNKFSIRGRLDFQTAANLSILSLLILTFLRWGERKSQFIFKYFWVFQINFTFVLLLASEILLLRLFAFEMNNFHLKYIIMIYDILWWITPAHLINLVVKRFLWKPLEDKTGQTVPNVVRLFISVLIYLLAIFGIVAFVYDQALTSLLATSGVLAMIIGLAIQINISNIFSGIVINLERPFRVNDGIKIQIGRVFHEGTVVDITWRTTRLMTQDGYILSIPNSVASEAVIHNYNYTEELCQSILNIKIDYAHPPARVEKILLDATFSTDVVLREPKPTCRFKGFNDWAAEYIIVFYVKDYAKKIICNEAVFKRVWVHLNRAGIVPPIQRQEVQMFQGMKSRRLDEASKPMALLQDMDIFQPLSEEHRKILGEKMRRKLLATGETVVKQGEAGDSMFVVVEGVVSVHVTIKDGTLLEVARLGAGNFFGEMALFTGQQRTATIITMTDTVFYEIKKEDIVPLMQEQPEVAQLISKVLTQRQMRTKSQVDSYGNPKIDKDLYKRMLDGVGDFMGLKEDNLPPSDFD